MDDHAVEAAAHAIAKARAGALLSLEELAAIWGTSRAQIYKLHQRGQLDHLKPNPPCVRPVRFAGALVMRFLDGAPPTPTALIRPSFGGTRRRRKEAHDGSPTV